SESWFIFASNRPSRRPPIMTVAARGALDFTHMPHSCQRFVRIACILGSDISGANVGAVSGVADSLVAGGFARAITWSACRTPSFFLISLIVSRYLFRPVERVMDA